jgi:diaminopimelate epimerase
MNFIKYEGTGNDFLILNTTTPPTKERIQQLCDRHFGVGADGVLFASPSSMAAIKMNYYNADGSIAKMCGNGLRCFATYLNEEQIITDASFTVETLAGLIDVSIDDASVTLNLGPAIIHPAISLQDQRVQPVSLMTEHAVLFGVSPSHIKQIGPAITQDAYFTDGVNTNFVDTVDAHTIKVQTHERGAGWTLSCGTGVAASAALAVTNGLVQSPVTVHVPGGVLTVTVDEVVHLKGPARRIATGEWA